MSGNISNNMIKLIGIAEGKMQNKKIPIKYVRQLKQGDAEAFHIIYEHYKQPLYFFIYKIVKNHGDSEDILQESFIKVWEFSNTLVSEQAFHVWLYKLVYNRAIEAYRRNERNGDLFDQIDIDYVPTQIEKLKEWERHEIKDSIQLVVNELPERFIVVAQLRFFEGFTTKEIAEILDLPEGTVKTRLNKIRSIIKPKLAKKGIIPRTYFTLMMPTFMFHVFKQLTNQQIVSQASKQLFVHISESVLVSKQIGATTMNHALKIKLALSIPLVSVGIYGTSQVIIQNMHPVYEIAYYQGITNQSKQVSIAVDNTIHEKDVQITKNNQKIPLDYQNNTIFFVAEENGVYTITFPTHQDNITIDGIDKQLPILKNISNTSSTITLDVSDLDSGIDYNKSYVLYQNNRLKLAKDGTINAILNEECKLVLFDNAGNSIEYLIHPEVVVNI